MRAEVERVYQSLRRMRGMTSGSKPAGTSPRKKEEERTDGLDGWISIDGMREKKEVVMENRSCFES